MRSPIDAPIVRSIPRTEAGTSESSGDGVGPFLLKSISTQSFGPGVPWTEVPSAPGMYIMSTASARDEETALHLLNTVVPPVDRRDPVTDEEEVPGLVRSWLHQEALVSEFFVLVFLGTPAVLG